MLALEFFVYHTEPIVSHIETGNFCFQSIKFSVRAVECNKKETLAVYTCSDCLFLFHNLKTLCESEKAVYVPNLSLPSNDFHLGRF